MKARDPQAGAQHLRSKLVRSSVGLLATTGLTILLAGGGAAFLNSERSLAALEVQIRANHVARGRHLAANHAHVFQSLVRDNAVTEVHDLLALTTAEPDVVFGVFSDSEGKPWSYCSSRVPCDPSREPEERISVSVAQVSQDLGLPMPLPQERAANTREITFLGEPVLEFSHPVFVDGASAGTLRYGISTASLRRTLSATRTDQQRVLGLTIAAIAVVLSGALLLGLWMARRTARRITQPLRELTAAAQELAAGDHRVHVEISSGDELQTLGNAFNRMVDDLRSSYSDLEAKNAELEGEIAERVQAQVELSETQAHLIQAQKMEAFGQIAGGVAHDFNNILAVILGNCELATDGLERVAGAEKLEEHLGEIFTAAKRGADLTRQLLTFARREGDKSKVSSVNEVLLEFEKLLRRVMEESVELRVVPGADLYPVRIDPGRLEQVLLNLCVNARDAMPGGGRLTVSTANTVFDRPHKTTTCVLPAGKFVVLRAADNGHGIAEPTLQRIFEPFFTTKGVGRGTGLGLATVHGIIRAADGAIDITTELNVGTTFSVYLPAWEGEEVARSEEPPEAALKGQGQVILLCEDDAAVRKMTEAALRSGGYEVVAAESGRQALQLLATTPFHALVTDVVMPDMDGSALALHANEMAPDLPILFVSGYTAGILLSHGVSEKSLHFLRKPFESQDLLRAVGRLIEKARRAGAPPSESDA